MLLKFDNSKIFFIKWKKYFKFSLILLFCWYINDNQQNNLYFYKFNLIPDLENLYKYK
jgi:hypothetical protein